MSNLTSNPPLLADVHQDIRPILRLSAQGGFDFVASRHPELARSAGSNSGAPPQTPQNQTTPGLSRYSGETLKNTLSSHESLFSLVLNMNDAPGRSEFEPPAIKYFLDSFANDSSRRQMSTGFDLRAQLDDDAGLPKFIHAFDFRRLQNV